MALSTFNLDFQRSLNFNINFFSTSWVKQMYASYKIRDFFNKQSFWMPLGRFQIINEVCMHFFTALVFIFKYIGIFFFNLVIVYSQIFLYFYFVFYNICNSQSNVYIHSRYSNPNVTSKS